TGGVMIGKDLAVDLLVRFYRDTWDNAGGGSDGGDLGGTGGGLVMRWTPSDRLRLRAALGALDDRFGLFATGAGQTEERDHDRVGQAVVDLSVRPDAPLPLELGAALSWGYDAARTRTFASVARARQFVLDHR